MPITGAQVRMARAALQWGVRDLAKRAQMSPNTITAVEAGKEVRAATLTVLQQVLEAAGVEFLPAGMPAELGGPGVRLRQ